MIKAESMKRLSITWYSVEGLIGSGVEARWRSGGDPGGEGNGEIDGDLSVQS